MYRPVNNKLTIPCASCRNRARNFFSSSFFRVRKEKKRIPYTVCVYVYMRDKSIGKTKGERERERYERNTGYTPRGRSALRRNARRTRRCVNGEGEEEGEEEKLEQIKR